MNPGSSPLIQHIGKCLLIINHRFCISHADHGCIASARCRPGPGFYILLIGQTRVPKMNMHVYKPRRRRQTGSVQNPIASGLLCRLICGYNFSFRNYQIQHLISAIGRIQNPYSPNPYHSSSSFGSKVLLAYSTKLSVESLTLYSPFRISASI